MDKKLCKLTQTLPLEHMSIVVNVIGLQKTLSHKSCLISFNSAISAKLQLIHQFALDCLPPRWQINKHPSFGLHGGFILIFHGKFPLIAFRGKQNYQMNAYLLQ